MIEPPSRQPVRQIIQRHNQDCAIGAGRTGSETRLLGEHRSCATIRPAAHRGMAFWAGPVSGAGPGSNGWSRTRAARKMVKPQGLRLVWRKDLKLLLRIGQCHVAVLSTVSQDAGPTVIDIYLGPGRKTTLISGP